MLTKSYWDLVEPFWGQISIYDGYELLQYGLQKVPTAVQHLFAAHWCQSEVLNGGLHQFFSNCTGVLAPEAVAGFAAVGMPQLAACVQQAMKFFGELYPRDFDLRNEALDAYTLTNADDWNPFDALDELFYNLLETETGGWEQAADSYAAQQAG